MKRGKPLVRTAIQRKRAGLKRTPRPSARKLEGIVPARWLSDVIELTSPLVKLHGHRVHVCPVCGKPPMGEGRLEGHHVLSRQRIKKYVAGLQLDAAAARLLLAELIYDKRNGLACCTTCHERHTKAVKRIPRSVLLPMHFEFADALGLGYFLDRYYPETP